MLVGRDLLEMGYHEGPRIGVMLSGLLMARLDGEVETREDEIEWLQKNHPVTDTGSARKEGKEVV
jgi:tRNA nucleotidyltransferase (CCA-adding enzyme)